MTEAHPLAGSALALLAGWPAPTQEQATLREAYLALLATTSDALWRAHAPGHVTVGAVVLDATATHTLLELHPRAGMWLPPGGHCEPEDATLADGALREVREETGLVDVVIDSEPVRLDAHPFTCSLGVPTRHLNVGFVVRTRPTADGTPPVATISDESDDLRWWPVDALPAPRPERLAAEVAAALARTPRG
ncbi:NUDIX hydrolase [Miniimonas arenae]|uniref:NUDIX hydrolase n=1 Tax=Miniimonas arenae TaxID=676201 RepID=UPI0028B189DD|nr:NUDIX domain-containing protein [Miniimonas arenae]